MNQSSNAERLCSCRQVRWRPAPTAFVLLCLFLPGFLLARSEEGATTALDVPRPGDIVPRWVLALYDSQDEPDVHFSRIHRLAELPLNHLGLLVRYHDIRKGVPTPRHLGERDWSKLRGVLSWFSFTATDQPEAYLAFASRMVDSGKKFLVLGHLGVVEDGEGGVPLAQVNDFWGRLGLQSQGTWIGLTYDLEVSLEDPSLFGFERPLRGVLPGYPVLSAIDSTAKPYLEVLRRGVPGSKSQLVLVGDRGGYAAAGYIYYRLDDRTLQWYLDPFRLFRLAFATDNVPKPDATTLAGRRIFYSHIDGDGWRNRSEHPRYRERHALAAEVILEEILKPFPDFPVTVAPVAGDLDPAWHGTSESVDVARRIFALPQVEAGSHTYSHPLDWGFFAPRRPGAGRDDTRRNGAKPSDGSPDTLWDRLRKLWPDRDDMPAGVDGGGALADWEEGYERPQSYLIEPFDLEREISGSVALIRSLLPQGKEVEVVQWSGNTLPFEEAIAAVRKEGLRNINGGDSRYDREFPSYAWIAPLGRRVGDELQIYASNSNENTYTERWTERFFGFEHLRQTLMNTESPRRIKPFNVYYHMYSGEKLASLLAVQANLRYAQSQRLHPVTTSEYAAIVEGFYSAEMIRLDEDRWQVSSRGALQTVRLDGLNELDFSRCRGIIGSRHYQGNLYVYLDAAEPRPVIALGEGSRGETPDHLIESRWKVYNLERGEGSFVFQAQGHGRGRMTWAVSAGRHFEIELRRESEEDVYRFSGHSGSDGRLELDLPSIARRPVRIRISQGA